MTDNNWPESSPWAMILWGNRRGEMALRCCVICQGTYNQADEAEHYRSHGHTVGERMDAWLKAELQRSERVSEAWNGATQVAQHALAILREKTPDHRALLVKYLVHIADNEGSSFLNVANKTLFTPEEWNELCQCDRESRE